MTSAVQKASQALNERGERLGRAEEKTEELKNSAQQFAETAHKVRFGWDTALSLKLNSFISRGGSSRKNCSPLLFTNSLLFSLIHFLITWQISDL